MVCNYIYYSFAVRSGHGTRVSRPPVPYSDAGPGTRAAPRLARNDRLTRPMFGVALGEGRPGARALAGASPRDAGRAGVRIAIACTVGIHLCRCGVRFRSRPAGGAAHESRRMLDNAGCLHDRGRRPTRSVFCERPRCLGPRASSPRESRPKGSQCISRVPRQGSIKQGSERGRARCKRQESMKEAARTVASRVHSRVTSTRRRSPIPTFVSYCKS